MIPITKRDYYRKIDEVLSEEDKKLLASDERIDTHFTLGLWIRNKWIYPGDRWEGVWLKLLFGESDADILSSKIIECYRVYLRKKCKR